MYDLAGVTGRKHELGEHLATYSEHLWSIIRRISSVGGWRTAKTHSDTITTQSHAALQAANIHHIILCMRLRMLVADICAIHYIDLPTGGFFLLGYFVHGLQSVEVMGDGFRRLQSWQSQKRVRGKSTFRLGDLDTAQHKTCWTCHYHSHHTAVV